MKFAKIGEEVFERQEELTGEELRLYSIIVFHTWGDSGVCKKTLGEISKIYRLPYNHLTERYKKLRQKGWCENTKNGVRPLVFAKTPKIGVADDENSKNRSEELQKSELETPKIGVIDSEKLQKSEFVYKEYTEPLKSRDFSTAAAEKKPVAEAAAASNNYLSKFSLEECLRYAEICQLRGDPIRSVEALARRSYQTGEMDAFITATLYPETIQIEVEKSVRGKTDDLTDALNILRDLQSEGEDITDFQKYYPPDIWARLMEEIKQ